MFFIFKLNILWLRKLKKFLWYQSNFTAKLTQRKAKLSPTDIEIYIEIVKCYVAFNCKDRFKLRLGLQNVFIFRDNLNVCRQTFAQPTFTLFFNWVHNSNDEKQNKSRLHFWTDVLQIQKVKEWSISQGYSDLTEI